MFDLTGKVAIVTGGNGGIGLGMAKGLAKAGARVVVAGRNEEKSKAAVRELQSLGRDALAINVDVADEASVDAAIARVEAGLPPIVGLANVAGVASPVPFLDVTPAEWDRVFGVNTRGTFLVTRRVVPAMIAQGVGRIVSVSSASAQTGGGVYSRVPYSAAKAAVIGFSRALARELAPHAITVNSVTPGPIDTDIMGGTLTDERKAEVSAGTLLRRVGTPDEVAALIAFLCSADAGYITAATYDINGGLHMS